MQTKRLELNGYILIPCFSLICVHFEQYRGDGEASMNKRVLQCQLKLRSFLTGLLWKANGKGKRTSNSIFLNSGGQRRLMAVAYKENTFGSGEANITVADPLVLSTHCQDFKPKGYCNCAVTITNTTSRSSTATEP